jgi:hypothetical protein
MSSAVSALLSENRGGFITIITLGLFMIVVNSMGIHLYNSCSCDKDSNASNIRYMFIILLVASIVFTLYGGVKLFLLHSASKAIVDKLQGLRTRATEFLDKA